MAANSVGHMIYPQHFFVVICFEHPANVGERHRDQSQRNLINVAYDKTRFGVFCKAG